MLRRPQDPLIADGNVFEVLMDAVRVCSLGQITGAPFELGGQYRRNMSRSSVSARPGSSKQRNPKWTRR